jgi:hypothetical protein
MQFATLETSETMLYLTLYSKIFEHRLNRFFPEIAKKDLVVDLVVFDVVTTKNNIICNPCMQA